MMTLGLWTWVFSTQYPGPKPDFMFTVFDTGEKTALPLGFSGFPPVELFTIPVVDQALSLWVAIFFVGLGLALYAEGGIALIESITQAFGHVVSYTRIAAVLLAKAGMALAVNLLVFGAYAEGGEFHFIFFEGMPADESLVIFSGLFNLEGAVGLVFGVVFGLLVIVLGHLLVLVLGITSAGLQAVRLEYVEFFGKFYEGGGTVYNPFGHERTYTTED
jgi:V/A-type H+-transporting ATPase subunit I